MGRPSFPAYIDIKTLPDDMRKLASTVASKVKDGNLILITGGSGTSKESFACVLALEIEARRQGKYAYFVYATSIESAKVGEDEPWWHIVIFSMADQIHQKHSRAVLARMTQLCAAGNIPIVLVRGVHTFTKVYGEDFIAAYSDIIKIVALPEPTQLELESL